MLTVLLKSGLFKCVRLLKENWKTILVVLVLLFAAYGLYAFFKYKQDDFSSKLKNLQEFHDSEVAALVSARDIERKEHEENLKRLQDTLELTKKQYEVNIKELSEKKQRQVTQLVVKYGDDPVEMARQVASVTGFQLVLPE